MALPLNSIAIAGAWGYIGRKLLDAALRRGMRVHIFDPGTPPADLDLSAVTRVENEAEFYVLDANWFHLALHPEARREGETRLLQRAQSEPIWMLNEKPMFAPDHPRDARALIEAVDRSQAVMLYDFPELFDPLTQRITAYLAGFRHVEISSITTQRSKDREDPAIARNFKRMVPIQFQESVHCLAYALFMLGTVGGSFDAALANGVRVSAKSEPYVPPNPEVYPRVVDGRCDFQLTFGQVKVAGVTNFRRGAPWSKRRVLRGRADGQPFEIEADYLEGRKMLRINGVDQGWNAAACSYEAILSTWATWRANVSREQLLHGLYPNPRLAWLAFQLSGALWRSSFEGRRIELADLAAINSFDSGYQAALPGLPRYPASGSKST